MLHPPRGDETPPQSQLTPTLLSLSGSRTDECLKVGGFLGKRKRGYSKPEEGTHREGLGADAGATPGATLHPAAGQHCSQLKVQWLGLRSLHSESEGCKPKLTGQLPGPCLATHCGLKTFMHPLGLSRELLQTQNEGLTRCLRCRAQPG